MTQRYARTNLVSSRLRHALERRTHAQAKRGGAGLSGMADVHGAAAQRIGRNPANPDKQAGPNDIDEPLHKR